MPTDASARSIEPVLAQFVVDELLYDREVPKVEPGEALVNNLLDSMDILNLVGFLEERFGVRVEDDELVPENFETLRAVASFVSGKLAGREAAG